MYRILVCDDEVKIRETFRDYLSAKGFEVVTAADGREAVQRVGKDQFDLIILDVMMPVMNGIEACKCIRKQSNVPVLFLSALGEEYDILEGFKSGCDDYIVKPFPMSVLAQKCNVMILRSKGESVRSELCLCGISLDKGSKTVTVDGQRVDLSNKAFRLLELLMENEGIVLSREQIISKIWGWDFEGDERAVDNHIKILRRALGVKAVHIKTVIGGGYSFREE